MSRLALAVGLVALAGGRAIAEPSVPLLEAAAGVYVGGAPDERLWAELEARGVKTVVGVEGVPPVAPTDLGSGVRLVHIPIGYDGVDPRAAGQLTRVAREAERPLYVYCHHGRHRGPAAAAIVCRAAGLLDESGAVDLLRQANTDPKYAGLWRDVAAYQPPPTDADLPELTSASPTSPLRLAMCQLDRAWETVDSAETRDESRAAWVLVVESLIESRRAAEGGNADLVDRLQRALESAEDLEESDSDPDSRARLERFGQRCHDCHATHRD